MRCISPIGEPHSIYLEINVVDNDNIVVANLWALEWSKNIAGEEVERIIC